MCVRIIQHRNSNICQSTEENEMTRFIIIGDDESAARSPLAPVTKSKAASPQALPTQRVKIGYLQS
jgi:hypothetical protein